MSIAVIGGMTIDDLVLADGSVHRRVPGGNALYSALGAHLWGAEVEIVSFVGSDYPEHVLQALADRGIGTGQVHRRGDRSIRLWLLYEEDARRQIHLQHDSPTLEPLSHVARTAIDALMGAPQPPTFAHLSALPVRVQRVIGQRLAEADIAFTLDTLEARGSVGGDLLEFVQDDPQGLAPTAFLPSREEFTLIFGREDSRAARAWRQTTSISALVIKDGAAGSLVFEPPSAMPIRLPALTCEVQDPTGAGDAFCGGYAAGSAQGKPAWECALMGTVSASFVVEGVGIRGLLDTDVDERGRRVERLQQLRGQAV